MTHPDPHSIIIPGESADDVMDVYRDILARTAHDPSAPSPLEVLDAWLCTAAVWKVARLAVDPQSVIRTAYTGSAMSRRSIESADFAHREVVRRQALTEIKTIRTMVKELKGESHRALGVEPALRVVK